MGTDSGIMNKQNTERATVITRRYISIKLSSSSFRITYTPINVELRIIASVSKNQFVKSRPKADNGKRIDIKPIKQKSLSVWRRSAIS